MAMKSTKFKAFEALPVEQRMVLGKQTMYTTGDMAVLCGVAPRSIAKWMDLGHFPNAYRLPNTKFTKTGPDGKNGDRRIPRQDVLAFARRFNISRAIEIMCPKENAPTVLVGLSPSQVGTVTNRLGVKELVVVHTLVEGAVAVGKCDRPPARVVVHADNPASQIKELAEFVTWRAAQAGFTAEVIVVYPADYCIPTSALPDTIKQRPETALLSIFDPESEVA